MRARAFADGAAGDEAAASGSAVAALRLGLSVLLRLFAPVLPYITEEVWSWSFAAETGQASIHAAPWPSERDFADVAAPEHAGSFDVAVAALTAINKAKADGEVSMGREVESMVLVANPATLARVAAVKGDVLRAARCLAHETAEDASLEDDVFVVRDAVFAPKPER